MNAIQPEICLVFVFLYYYSFQPPSCLECWACITHNAPRLLTVYHCGLLFTCRPPCSLEPLGHSRDENQALRTSVRFYAAPFGATSGGLQLLFFFSMYAVELPNIWKDSEAWNQWRSSLAWAALPRFLSSEFVRFRVERESRTRLLARTTFGNKSLWSAWSFLQDRPALGFTQATNTRWTPPGSSCGCSQPSHSITAVSAVQRCHTTLHLLLGFIIWLLMT